MKSISLVVFLAIVGCINAAVTGDFDDFSLVEDSHWSGNYTIDGTGGTYDTTFFNSGSMTFENHSDGDWGGWAGFAYSNEIDTSTVGFTNQFSVYAGQAQSGSNFGIGYQDSFNAYNPRFFLNSPCQISGVYITNTTYAALDMLNGTPGFSKKFGGDTGNDEDWFLLTVTGKDAIGDSTDFVEFYLADYRFTDNNADFIVDAWKYVDLSSLGVVSGLEFTMTSSDTGTFGMNTPSYFAIDTIIPEPATIVLVGLGSLLLRRKQ